MHSCPNACVFVLHRHHRQVVVERLGIPDGEMAFTVKVTSCVLLLFSMKRHGLTGLCPCDFSRSLFEVGYSVSDGTLLANIYGNEQFN